MTRWSRYPEGIMWARSLSESAPAWSLLNEEPVGAYLEEALSEAGIRNPEVGKTFLGDLLQRLGGYRDLPGEQPFLWEAVYAMYGDPSVGLSDQDYGLLARSFVAETLGVPMSFTVPLGIARTPERSSEAFRRAFVSPPSQSGFSQMIRNYVSGEGGITDATIASALDDAIFAAAPYLSGFMRGLIRGALYDTLSAYRRDKAQGRIPMSTNFLEYFFSRQAHMLRNIFPGLDAQEIIRTLDAMERERHGPPPSSPGSSSPSSSSPSSGSSGLPPAPSDRSPGSPGMGPTEPGPGSSGYQVPGSPASRSESGSGSTVSRSSSGPSYQAPERKVVAYTIDDKGRPVGAAYTEKELRDLYMSWIRGESSTPPPVPDWSWDDLVSFLKQDPRWRNDNDQIWVWNYYNETRRQIDTFRGRDTGLR